MSDEKERPFFLIEVIFESPIDDWSEKYLQTSEYRLTHLLREEFGNDFWEVYSRVLVDYHQKGRLLLRTKSIFNKSVILTQVWKSRQDYLQYMAEALQGRSIKKALENQGMKVTEAEEEINRSEIELLLTKIEERPHLLQFLHPEWRRPERKIGDPLKVGKMYLPFPENK